MGEKKIGEARFSDTGYSYTLSLIAGKYKPVILYLGFHALVGFVRELHYLFVGLLAPELLQDVPCGKDGGRSVVP